MVLASPAIFCAPPRSQPQCLGRARPGCDDAEPRDEHQHRREDRHEDLHTHDLEIQPQRPPPSAVADAARPRGLCVVGLPRRRHVPDSGPRSVSGSRITSSSSSGLLALPPSTHLEEQLRVIRDDAVRAGTDAPLHPLLVVDGPDEQPPAGLSDVADEELACRPDERLLEHVEGQVRLVAGEESARIERGPGDEGDGVGGQDVSDVGDVGLLRGPIVSVFFDCGREDGRTPTYVPAAEDDPLLPWHRARLRGQDLGHAFEQFRRRVIGLFPHNERQQVLQPRQPLPGLLHGAQRPQVGPLALTDLPVDAEAAFQVPVVREHDDAVARQVQVRLEGVRAGVEGGAEGEEGIFGVEGLEATVGYRLW
ncbi:hypothetical protein CTA1_10928 [Colletotrichum tanaceti]|uniref:Uncharacterized protein n=1 Tax=Colletotrichum tanaceti TaxID=1306861 RepID=A0A4U6XJQ7_9PEZI|nr:hypothetical protein CTA1_10928 [Colletotrichum tanaceti]